MGLVTLHTQALRQPVVTTYLKQLRRGLRAARLNNAFPDRRRLQASLDALNQAIGHGIYDELYLDSRTGLPNMASLTRVLTDQEVASTSLAKMVSRSELMARRHEAEVFAQLLEKHDYYTYLGDKALAPVDTHRTLLRRHLPERGEAAFRIEMTKLDGSGVYMHLVIELSQISSLWSRAMIDLDDDGETAAADEAFRTLVYRCAHLDAETIFVRLHGIEGVHVERVTRGVIGPVLYWLPDQDRAHHTLEVVEPLLGQGFTAWRQAVAGKPSQPQMLLTCASDFAAVDVREERSNDPLSPLLSTQIQDQERARYQDVRTRYPFRVFKDRKFVATRGMKPLAQEIMAAAGTRNLVYDLR